MVFAVAAALILWYATATFHHGRSAAPRHNRPAKPASNVTSNPGRSGSDKGALSEGGRVETAERAGENGVAGEGNEGNASRPVESGSGGGEAPRGPGRRAGLRVRSWAYQLQGADPRAIAGSGFDLVVMDYSRDGGAEGEYSREEIGLIKASGVIPVAYLSIGEAEDYRFYWRDSWREKPPPWLGPENPEWRGNYAVRYWEEGWKRIVFRYLDRIIAQGFSGVYLDKVDEFEYWGGRGVNETWAAREMIKFILEIARYARSKAGPGFLVIPQNGERLLDYDNGSLLAAVSGWASEDVFYDGLEPSPWTGEKVPRLSQVTRLGKPVLVVDYVDDGSRSRADLARILDFRRKALEHGFVPYAALVDRELDELNVIPGVQP